MIKVWEIVSHGKYYKAAKLIGKMLECPECDFVGYHTESDINAFDIIETHKNSNIFTVICKKCNCKFVIEVK